MAEAGKRRLGEVLLYSGMITEEQLEQALAEQVRIGSKLGQALISMGLMRAEEMAEAIARQLGATVMDISSIRPDPELLRMTPESIARKHVLFPVGVSEGVVRIAMADPLNLMAVDELSARLSKDIEVVISTEEQILSAISKFYGSPSSSGYDLDDKAGEQNILFEQEEIYGTLQGRRQSESPPPVARIVEKIIRQAVYDRASDIHIEPLEDELQIRYRVDGMMFPASAPSKRMEQAIISRVKIIARMDIAETRIPQEGGFTFLIDGRKVELRVSTFPTIYGESVVIRILDRANLPLALVDLGLSGSTLSRFNKAISAKSGIVIVTGPTGSGKTTTLYAALSAISSPQKTVVTIEDPVEYRIDYVRQTQVNPKAGLTFAKGLRSMLRQDPDIIMVGEIRDQETAAIAIQAAMTGHMVLTTMHTSDAAGAITRMMDLGVEPYKIAATFAGALAQRLVRKICNKCKTQVSTGNGNGAKPVYRGDGCSACKHSGYKNRVGIYEFLGADNEIRNHILSRAPSIAIKDHMKKSQAMETILEDGLKKAAEGITTSDETLRVVDED